MALHETHCPDAPFDLIRFEICPTDVETYFILDSDFQRSVRARGPMLDGIRSTLLYNRILQRPIDVCRLKRKGKGKDRFIVIDGKHRLHALATLDKQVRCTIYALVYKVAGAAEIVQLFQTFNLTVPPSLSHLLKLDFRRDDPTLIRLGSELPFDVYVPGMDRRKPDAISVNKVIQWICRSFGGFPKFNRFAKSEIFDGITRYHVSLLGDFSLIFEEAHKPITPRNEYVRAGWFEFLLRIFVQNQHLGLTATEWSRRIKTMFAARPVDRFLADPKVTMQTPEFRNVILRAMHEPHQPQIKFDPASPPTIAEVLKQGEKGALRKVV